jgi:hypothetical protein
VTADRHARVARLLREHGPLAPPALRSRVEGQIERANARKRPRAPVAGPLALAGSAVAASLVAIALVLPGLLSGEPTVADAHALAGRGPTDPAPSRVAGSPALLAADVDGVPFPSWKREFGWRSVGERSDELDGRRTRTVFYGHEGHRIGYTIVSGEALEAPEDAARRRVNGVDLRVWRDDHGHDIVAFERGGRTCVLSGHVERRSTLVDLASWSGDGEVRF